MRLLETRLASGIKMTLRSLTKSLKCIFLYGRCWNWDTNYCLNVVLVVSSHPPNTSLCHLPPSPPPASPLSILYFPESFWLLWTLSSWQLLKHETGFSEIFIICNLKKSKNDFRCAILIIGHGFNYRTLFTVLEAHFCVPREWVHYWPTSVDEILLYYKSLRCSNCLCIFRWSVTFVLFRNNSVCHCCCFFCNGVPGFETILWSICGSLQAL